MRKTTIYNIRIIVIFALCLGFSSTLHAATNTPVAVWSCTKCTLENKIGDTQCVACGNANPACLKHHSKSNLPSDSSINVKFIKPKSQKPPIYSFKVLFNNRPCEMSRTYAFLYATRQDIIKKHRVDEQQLVFPSENISTNYLQCGNQLQQYLISVFSVYHQTKHEGILDILGLWICDICKIFNNKDKTCIQCNSAQLTINVRRRYNSYFDPIYDYLYAFSISITYAEDISLAYVLDKVIGYINNEAGGQDYVYLISSIGASSFIGRSVANKITSTANYLWDVLLNKKITAWNKEEITKKGLSVYIAHRYHHSLKKCKISCKHITYEDTLKYSGLELALQCPIYSGAVNYVFTKETLLHLHFYSHFLDEYNEKPVCKHGAACFSFIRLEHNGNLIKDLCHIKLYRHPPRNNRQIKLHKNINKFICTQNEDDNKPLYELTYMGTYNLLWSLIDEVTKHGYRYDLCLTCTSKDRCTHDVYQKNKNSLVSIIEDKFNHPRYKKMGRPFHSILRPNADSDAFMLSLILYTGCDCNYDMCKSQRNGNYDKWKIFDFCLWNAIYCLSQKEFGAYKLYSGLRDTNLPTTMIKSGYFPTYTSTTLYKDIAKRFVGTQGMMIEIDQAVRNAFICCDVSWISKFGVSESEVLIARTPSNVAHPGNNFFVKILDNKLGIQTVSLTPRPSYDLACEDIISKISAIIAGKTSDDSKLPAKSVILVFKELISRSKDVPDVARKRWDAFRNKQESITINIGYMYENYKVFIPLLFSTDPELKNLLLLDKIVQIFPNVVQVICENINRVREDCCYSSHIINSNFMSEVKYRLQNMHKDTKLEKIIIIQTYGYKMPDECNLYAKKFAPLGWKIGNGNNTIVITKTPYDDCIEKISSMVQGEKPFYEITSLDMTIFNKLIAGGKDLPTYAQERWNEVRRQRLSIKIDMQTMYFYYKAFVPLLFDPKCENLLLLGKIVRLFPFVIEIICANIHLDAHYSIFMVGGKYMLGVKNMLSEIDKNASLMKIVIKTFHRIDDNIVEAFSKLGWYRESGRETVLTKHPDYYIEDRLIPTIRSMISGKEQLNKATPLDKSVFCQLIYGRRSLPDEDKIIWRAFRKAQKCIIIDMRAMYEGYKTYRPLLFDPKCKNLLIFDKIAGLFPNLTEIICKNVDYIGAYDPFFNPYKDPFTNISNYMEEEKSRLCKMHADKKIFINPKKIMCADKDYIWVLTNYSATVVSSNFMLGLKGRLSRVGKHKKLKKIIIQTKQKEIGNNCKLYATQFRALGWKIDKESYNNKWEGAKKNNQITLTRL